MHQNFLFFLDTLTRLYHHTLGSFMGVIGSERRQERAGGLKQVRCSDFLFRNYIVSHTQNRHAQSKNNFLTRQETINTTQTRSHVYHTAALLMTPSLVQQMMIFSFFLFFSRSIIRTASFKNTIQNNTA